MQVRLRDSPTDLTGDIVFRDVVFSYPTRPDTRILDGLSCIVPAQQALAIVGESGSGTYIYCYYSYLDNNVNFSYVVGFKIELD